MLINNIDISNFDAKLLSKNIQTAEIITFDDWLRQSPSPIYLAKKELYKKIEIKLYINNANDDIALNNISNLVKQFQKCIVKFDDVSFYYDCLIVGSNVERIENILGAFTVEIELKGYAYKDYIIETANRVSTKTINVPGNQNTPAVVEIIPSIDIIDIVLTGLSDSPIIVKNLKAGKKVILNGEDGTVLENGVNKFSDTDTWEFPYLKPGANTITFSKANCDITIKYKPRWI